MIKKIAVCLLAVVLMILLTACGGGKEVDLDALAGELTASSAFTMDMSQFQTGAAAIAQTYGFDEGEVVKSLMYYNTGTAEEIFLAQGADSKAADHLEELCKARVDGQIDWMQNYIPDAVPRLDSAVLAKSGEYVVLVVANDNAAAKTIVDSYLK